MRLIKTLCSLALLLPSLAGAGQSTAGPFNVLSFNIRYNTPNDGENAWPYRKQHVAALIQFHQADIVGLQEAKLDQLSDLAALLPHYRWLGVARDDGKTDSPGEYAAILYRADKFTPGAQGSFWCSLEPDKPSKGWDAMFNRNTNWVKLLTRKGQPMYLFNSHFDHLGSQSRRECARLLRSRVDEIAGGAPVVVTGDFNSTPLDPPYQQMTDNSDRKTPLFDAAKISELPAYGPGFTFTGFDMMANQPQPIDYIFVSEQFQVKRFGVLTDSLNGRLPSDHYPLLAELWLNR